MLPTQRESMLIETPIVGLKSIKFSIIYPQILEGSL